MSAVRWCERGDSQHNSTTVVVLVVVSNLWHLFPFFLFELFWGEETRGLPLPPPLPLWAEHGKTEGGGGIHIVVCCCNEEEEELKVRRCLVRLSSTT